VSHRTFTPTACDTHRRDPPHLTDTRPWCARPLLRSRRPCALRTVLAGWRGLCFGLGGRHSPALADACRDRVSFPHRAPPPLGHTHTHRRVRRCRSFSAWNKRRVGIGQLGGKPCPRHTVTAATIHRGLLVAVSHMPFIGWRFTLQVWSLEI